jgi:hypothetical protein
VAARIVTCNGSSQVLNYEEYSQRGSFEFRLLVLLVASALSRWFFSVVITSNSILSVVALNLWLLEELSYTTLVLGFSFEQFQFTDNISIISFMLLTTFVIVSVY